MYIYIHTNTHTHTPISAAPSEVKTESAMGDEGRAPKPLLSGNKDLESQCPIVFPISNHYRWKFQNFHFQNFQNFQNFQILCLVKRWKAGELGDRGFGCSLALCSWSLRGLAHRLQRSQDFCSRLLWVHKR